MTHEMIMVKALLESKKAELEESVKWYENIVKEYENEEVKAGINKRIVILKEKLKVVKDIYDEFKEEGIIWE